MQSRSLRLSPPYRLKCRHYTIGQRRVAYAVCRENWIACICFLLSSEREIEITMVTEGCHLKCLNSNSLLLFFSLFYPFLSVFSSHVIPTPTSSHPSQHFGFISFENYLCLLSQEIDLCAKEAEVLSLKSMASQVSDLSAMAHSVQD